MKGYFRGRTCREIGDIEYVIYFKYATDPAEPSVGIFHVTAHSVEILSITDYETNIKYKVDQLPEEALPKALLAALEAEIEADQDTLLDVAGFE